ncbi:hypothetical protein LDO26_11305 [Luteimonas sp. BDR2-5]|uniref:hypothetical protein n=1 Tax=Proluteimonas luteida TaxID=2878685 RepID=UPI001E28F7A8|nr:hypothetical protein [Luteimonas sp. BDR2-5]MCD9028793.1 hypothetical protein [Luteimonas sp. BDR2-5]
MKVHHTLMLMFLPALVACGDIGCENEVAFRVPSPSGKKDAVVYSRNCGATTGFNTQLQIVAAGSQPRGGSAALAMDGDIPLKLVWQSDGALVIAGVGQGRIFGRESSSNGVSLTYEP